MSELLTIPAAADAPRFDMVPFAGTEILAAQDRDEVRVPMKPLCGAIGLPWEPQRKRIGRDPVLAEGASMMEVPTRGGVQRQLALPLHLVPGFLFTADADRYAPELRERVHLFRKECFQVLHAHFACRPVEPVEPIAIDPATAREGVRLVTMLKRETSPEIRRMYHGFLDQLCAGQGIATPAIAAIGADALPSAELVAPLLRGLETLTMMGIVWNHSSQPGVIAFDLAELLEHFDRLMITMPAMSSMSQSLREHADPVFEKVSIVSNLTGRPRLCWAYEDRADG
ncbi:hypothetical protein O4H52_08030 [Sphingomonadaceae bacterium G21617-S1]|nr:hypothetical protein [Sphingomonadaceae bacterium G21617-S1]